MNKTELVAAVSDKTGFTKTACEQTLKAILDTIVEANKKGNPVQLIGFGTFSVGKRAARTYRNPVDGSKVKSPACKTVKFKAGAAYKNTVNGKAPAKATKAAKPKAKAKKK